MSILNRPISIFLHCLQPLQAFAILLTLCVVSCSPPKVYKTNVYPSLSKTPIQKLVESFNDDDSLKHRKLRAFLLSDFESSYNQLVSYRQQAIGNLQLVELIDSVIYARKKEILEELAQKNAWEICHYYETQPDLHFFLSEAIIASWQNQLQDCSYQELKCLKKSIGVRPEWPEFDKVLVYKKLELQPQVAENLENYFEIEQRIIRHYHTKMLQKVQKISEKALKNIVNEMLKSTLPKEKIDIEKKFYNIFERALKEAEEMDYAYQQYRECLKELTHARTLFLKTALGHQFGEMSNLTKKTSPLFTSSKVVCPINELMAISKIQNKPDEISMWDVVSWIPGLGVIGTLAGAYQTYQNIQEIEKDGKKTHPYARKFVAKCRQQLNRKLTQEYCVPYQLLSQDIVVSQRRMVKKVMKSY